MRREEVGGGDTHDRVGGDELLFGLTDVRAALEQRRTAARPGTSGGSGWSPSSAPRAIGGGVAAQEQVELVLRRLDPSLDFGNLAAT